MKKIVVMTEKEIFYLYGELNVQNNLNSSDWLQVAGEIIIRQEGTDQQKEQFLLLEQLDKIGENK